MTCGSRQERVRIDASTRCQLDCPICPTANGSIRDGVIGEGYLASAEFDRFLRRHPSVRHVELSSWGEIFLNPELCTIIALAHDRGVSLSAGGGVNFNYVDAEVLEALVVHRVRYIEISIDGATPETYSLYRRRGDFDRVMANLEDLLALKRSAGSEFPEIMWKFALFGHNEHELAAARARATELGVGFRVALNIGAVWGAPQYSPVNDSVRARAESGLDAVSLAEYREKHGRPYIQPCAQLWDAPQINWDGKLLGCCHNTYGDFGNVFEVGLEECMRSEAYVSAQRMVVGTPPPRADVPCASCNIYRQEILPAVQ